MWLLTFISTNITIRRQSAYGVIGNKVYVAGGIDPSPKSSSPRRLIPTTAAVPASCSCAVRRDQRQDLLRRRGNGVGPVGRQRVRLQPAANTWIPIASVPFTTSEAAVTVANGELVLQREGRGPVATSDGDRMARLRDRHSVLPASDTSIVDGAFGADEVAR